VLRYVWIVILALTSGGCPATEEPSVPPKALGTPREAGARLDPKSFVLWCTIRNRGEKSVRINDYSLGYWEAVTIRVLVPGTGRWEEVPRREGVQRVLQSAGPMRQNLRDLQPGAVLAKPRGMVCTDPTGAPYSFIVGLWDFDWPKPLTGEVPIVVSQTLPDYRSEGTGSGTLESGRITIPPGRLGK
jgi:hypothetical protein